MVATDLADAATELSKTFTGHMLQPTDPAYETARRVHNGLIDKRPAIIAQCRGTADIVEAVKRGEAVKLCFPVEATPC